jgi:hypothetical protein
VRGETKIILFSQIMARIQNPQEEVAVMELKSEILKNLSTVLAPVLERIRTLSMGNDNWHALRAADVLDQVVSFGRALGLDGLEE